ncbi:hypothetical protein [Colwellia sp. UCD-KL20]|uniref:hypothetical protein n=1 Tax=Colwellia sp. UCD-KL20 TaxID=1917165 RepID=UPI0011774ED0|nr:hypothetical protein [Colwellia sp. UCD-KL20]
MKIFKYIYFFAVFFILLCAGYYFFLCSGAAYVSLKHVNNESVIIPINYYGELTLPELSVGKPSAGKKVAITAPEYKGTHVYHTLYLPKDWSTEQVEQGKTWPIIFEYTGNKYPKSGSTGEVKDASFGYGLSAGQYIWVSLPYISKNQTENQLTWWGDKEATVDYAKLNVPRIVKAFGGDPRTVILCGFSRGAIAVNHLGLHDEQVAKLWTAFIVHDHFDGEQEWKGKSWGSPLRQYIEESATRLKRVNGRPYLVTSVDAHSKRTKTFVETHLSHSDNFTYIPVNTKEIFGKFPHPIAKGSHTDLWPLLASPYRIKTWQWLNQIAAH